MSLELDFLFTEYGKVWLQEEYEEAERSTYDIAKELLLYANAVRRALLFHGIKPRSKSEAQRVALLYGRGEHPTAGRKRTLEERLKIAAKVRENWSEMPEEERERRSKYARERWEALTPVEKRKILDKARENLLKRKQGSPPA